MLRTTSCCEAAFIFSMWRVRCTARRPTFADIRTPRTSVRGSPLQPQRRGGASTPDPVQTACAAEAVTRRPSGRQTSNRAGRAARSVPLPRAQRSTRAAANLVRGGERVANLRDPVTQATPWPRAGNRIPNSPDKRHGDGSFGDASIHPVSALIRKRRASAPNSYTRRMQSSAHQRRRVHRSEVIVVTGRRMLSLVYLTSAAACHRFETVNDFRAVAGTRGAA
jgi:hypothetical protein